MCSVTDGAATLCEWGRKSRTRREVVPLLLASNMTASEIASFLGRRPDGTRTSAVQVRITRREAEARGCLMPRAKTCPDCPPEKPTPTPLGGRCAPCQEAHTTSDQKRYRRRLAYAMAHRPGEFLPPPPPMPRLFTLGTTWYAPRHPSRVALPELEVRELSPVRVPSFSRARCEVDAWSRPTNQMVGA